MMQIYKLKFTSAIHIGIGRLGYDRGEEFIRSDTLMGAIASGWRKLYGEDPSFLFQEDVISMSSAFPYYNGFLFFPSPPCKIHLFAFPDENRKDVKRIKWIDRSLIDKFQNGEKLTPLNTILFGKFAVPKDAEEEFKVPVKSFKVERVAIKRIEQESTPFTFQEIKFIEGGGLYFIVDVKEEIKKKFEAVLHFMGDEGIGADRTVGKGFFKVEKVDIFDWPYSSDGTWYLLSLFIPTEKEIEKITLDKSSFSIMKRGGWVTYGNMNLRKRNIWAFEEGAILDSEEKPVGKNPVVLQKGEQIDFNVYRWGRAMVLPWRFK